MDRNTFSYLMRRFYEEIKSADIDEAYETFMLILDLVFIDKNSVPMFFQELLDKDTLRMLDDISLVKYNQKDQICKEGDHDLSLFIIVSGTVRISKKPVKSKGPLVPMPPVLLNHLITTLLTGGAKTLSNLSVGDFFGESALFSSKPMAVTATAETDVELMVITYKSLQKAMTVKPNLRSLLREYYVSRLDSMVEFLNKEQGMVQQCAFGALLGTVMPGVSSHNYTDTSMMLSSDQNSRDALKEETTFSLCPKAQKSAIENGLQKVINLYAANRKAEAALLYLSMTRVIFKDIAAVAATTVVLRALNNDMIKTIKPIYNALNKLQRLIPDQSPEPDTADSSECRMNFLMLFGELLKKKLDKAAELKFKPGQTVVKYGDASNAIYVVRAGAVRIYPHGASPEIEDDNRITTIGNGGIFGDFDFFNKKPRTATVIAAEDTVLYELDRPLATEIVKECPEALEFFRKIYQSEINNLIKEADAIKAYYKNDLMADHLI
ncbi:MAG: cyclic nucleotide-binding domain-containing protein [Nitrospirae bacterium]|nr:cyclic nucleotide-binding domain-containing protein [Nitrospirota bacterium]